MDLVPVRAGGHSDPDEPVLALSNRARILARIETTEVALRTIRHEIRMVGKVAMDETQITYISSYLPGRLDRLYVDYTGILVRKGDHLAEIYSPELLVAQREFLMAMEAVERAGARRDSRSSESGRDIGEATAQSVMEASRRKLELWGIPKDEIERLIRERKPSDHMRLDSPVEGWVVERQGFQGMYVETGTRLFTVVDLQSVWVVLDAYELDVQFLRYGQGVEFETESFPGHRFTGQLAYIDPVLNEATRTVKVRVNVPNPDLRLRPGMFVRAHVKVRLGEGGEVISDQLIGRWICPMHPEIVKDSFGQCDKCGMDLVASETLGYATQTTPAQKLPAVPATAVLLTGRRAVVYVEKEQDDGPVYEGRVVELGSRAGDWYVVLSGLHDGERVVTRGALMIDSAMQIQARPSMMQPPKEEVKAPETESRAAAGAAYHRLALPVVSAYLKLTETLAADNAAEAREAAKALRNAAGKAKPDGLTGEHADHFESRMRAIIDATPEDAAIGIEPLRLKLPAITSAVENYLRAFGHEGAGEIYRVYCPMALKNQGAYWLQPQPAIRNAYFGASMLRCGEVKARIDHDGKERPAND
jgi:Cu(I)/Ag(I) efflux system membrane fusion protein